MGRLIRKTEETLCLPGFILDRVGLVQDGEPTFEQYLELAKYLRHVEAAVHWLIGDMLVQAEAKWGQRYEQIMDETGFEYGTCANDKMVSKGVDFSRRREKLSWTHHQAVAGLEPLDQDNLLQTAETCGWSVKDLRAHIRERKASDEPPKHFDAIAEANSIYAYLENRRYAWPEEHRQSLPGLLRNFAERLEAIDYASERREGSDVADEGSCAESA